MAYLNHKNYLHNKLHVQLCSMNHDTLIILQSYYIVSDLTTNLLMAYSQKRSCMCLWLSHKIKCVDTLQTFMSVFMHVYCKY